MLLYIALSLTSYSVYIPIKVMIEHLNDIIVIKKLIPNIYCKWEI